MLTADDLPTAVGRAADPIPDIETVDLTDLLRRIGDARLVLPVVVRGHRTNHVRRSIGFRPGWGATSTYSSSWSGLRTDNDRYPAAKVAFHGLDHGGTRSWNLRGRHMFNTLQALMDLHGPTARGVVWAHNSHLGDARATSMAARGSRTWGSWYGSHSAGAGPPVRRSRHLSWTVSGSGRAFVAGRR
jgi:Erythromycin esterase